jgi:RNA polymerase sigma-70 factor, ECF subfamily
LNSDTKTGYNLCLYMLRHPEDARDFAPRASLYTWLYRIAINTCLDFKRKALRRPLDVERSTEEVAAPKPSPERIYESKQVAEEIELALERLPEMPRVAVVLREVEGHKPMPE